MKKIFRKYQGWNAVWLILISAICLTFSSNVWAQGGDTFLPNIEKRVNELIKEGDIPGLTLVIIRPNQPDYIGTFGVADLEKKTPVTRDSIFELASCSKAFTALAVLKAEEEGKLRIDDPVSKYLPWFKPTYKKQPVEITIRQLLLHTSGIPWNTIQDIVIGNDEDALAKTVNHIKNVELESYPGVRYTYSNPNYDVAAYIVEVVTGMKYEAYMNQYVFEPLGLTHTKVGIDRNDPAYSTTLTTGYKIGFFSPRKYQAPIYRGNWPAGYVFTNGNDLARWLKIQLGVVENPLSSLILKTHERNTTVAPGIDMSSYGLGWQVSLMGDGLIFHSGQNPNYTSYILLSPETKTAVAVMSNSDSAFTSYIANMVMNRMTRVGIFNEEKKPSNSLDKGFSVVSVILIIFICLSFIYFLANIFLLIKGKRIYEGMSFIKIGKIIGGLLMIIPFLIGLYLIPFAMLNISWETALIWAPGSFKTFITLMVAALGVSYFSYIFSILFPTKNRYFRSMPMLILLSILSGLANAIVIFLISASLYASDKQVVFLLYYFFLAMGLYLTGRKIIQTKLIRITFDLVYDLRMKLFDKIFFTSYQRFEKMDRGRTYATISDDTGQIGNSVNLFVQLLTSFITVLGCFIYLYTIAFWATVVTVLVIIAIATVYFFVSQKASGYLEKARDTRNDFLRLVNGLLDGFKELSIHSNKRKEYKSDLEFTTEEFRTKSSLGMIKFINAFMIGESLLIGVLGAVGFLVPRMFPNIGNYTLMSFIMVLLYLIGPINGILASIPGITQLRIAWKRVKSFEKDIPANMTQEEIDKLIVSPKTIESFEVKGVKFNYEKKEEENEAFSVGPIDFQAKKGEIVFVVGGNGSGKTTLAKLLTGLYIPHEGSLLIDGKEVRNIQLGEYFSAVFSGFFLFEKLYNIDIEAKKEEADTYLKLLHMDQKVAFDNKKFSSINLSGGQKKRLALLQCYLEDCPIYLFDELAADQDPEFRKFFYRDLLIRMKERGKIVIAITHDDHYFDVADKIIKMDMGKIDVITEGKTQLKVTQ